MLKKELQFLKEHKFFLIVLAVVALIPMLYNLIFLSSMWNPYGKLEHLPVAIVNEDQSTTYQGKKLAIGDQLVKNMKETKSLEYHFVSAKKAKQGIKKGDYYMKITIPKNFSTNAATLITKNPKNMIINYETTQGRNLTASKMSDSAMTTLKDKVSTQVTELYTKAILTQFGKVGDGMANAASGSKQLNSGTTKVEDASKLIQNNLQKLSSSTLEFSTGTETLTEGIKKYVSGVESVDEGTNQLSTGISTLSKSLPTLSSGMDQLNTGASSLASGVQQYTDGVNSVNTGAAQLATGLSKLENQTQNLPAQTKQLNDGVQQLAAGLKQVNLSNTQKNQLTAYVTGVQSYLTQVSAMLVTMDASSLNSDQLTSAITDVGTDLTNIQNLIAPINTKIETEKSAIQAAYQTDLSTNANAVTAALKTSGVTLSDDQKALILSTMKNQESQTLAEVNNLSVDGDSMNAGLNKANSDLQQLTTGMAALKNLPIDQLATLKTSTDNLANNSSDATTGLTTALDGLYSIGTTAAPAAEKIASATQTFNESTPTLVSAIQQLKAGSATLLSGTTTLTAKSPMLTNGINSLSSGLATAAKKIPTLSSGVGTLLQGSEKLSDGTTQLVSNGSQLVSGVQTLGSGAQKISSGAGQLSNGEGKVTTSLGQINDGINSLTDSLNNGANKVQQVNTSKSAAAAISQPVQTTHIDKDKVANNGTAMAPYMMSVALFVGCLTTNLLFDVVKPKKKPTSGLAWWSSKMAIVGTVAIIQAILVFMVLTLGLGLDPIYPVRVLFFLILEAITFMSIVTMFNVLFGKVGSFLMLIFMMLQLGGSSGTYPLELSNTFFEKISPFLPMTYSISALRQGVSMTGAMGSQTLIFASLTIISNLIIIVYFTRKKRTYQFPQAVEN
ncbi:YhgE/Pip domain-containing protein [Enterococcus hermanniensis]|uniref:YhgE/Pip domain-containing protein n=1 Tax=Enterococcus hermanniensis TaxID=249189 RepID=A0A1L8TPJ8_9ENTE|nr:YhgE/Pip domain-containing protein [Enterococcus hermanniensis]OJG46153.1 YhgE/Pip domain-containing protein [Enterococcus hermanniensis]